MIVPDSRFGGISALAIDRGRFLVVTDRGAVVRFDRPGKANPSAWLADLREGPGLWGFKWTRDAESLAADPGGRGWWVGYEQNHSLWLYDHEFRRPLANIDLNRDDWWNNRGAEGLISEGNHLLVTAENGRDLMAVTETSSKRLEMKPGPDVAEAGRAPDGTAWLLLRARSPTGFRQSVAPLIQIDQGYRVGASLEVPSGPLDNFEGMAIEPRPQGGLRFWVISDDGHRIMARTILVALDYFPSAGPGKGPAAVVKLRERAGNSV